MRALFWASLLFVVHTYLGYPLVLWVFTKIRSTDIRRRRIYPPVSIIIAARNERDKIRGKIEHTLTLQYPRELLEVIVASDASDDGTDPIAQQYDTCGVRLVRAPTRRGKEYVQGLAVAVAKGDVLVFTDAATILESDTLERLIQNFADQTVGAVSTEDVLVDAAGNATGEGIYVKYDMWVRRLESRFHSLVGLSGSCFAIRKELCADWSSTLASDFMGALRAARGGYRSVADPFALGKFTAVLSAELERPRKIRTFLRGITVLMANLDLLNPFRYGRFAFQLVSHKLLRFMSPFLLLIILATSAALMREQPFRAIFWTQVAFYALGTLGAVVVSLQRYAFIRVPYYFAMVQWAILVAWGKYGRGHRQVAWEPSKRAALMASDHGPTQRSDGRIPAGPKSNAHC